ncbi:MAG TPA: biotin--[acetyl-CoA-carboxylase] ligase [Xanthomonadales bacterium]|nr:biotin--[acetyl-CoA-carboxylase] ligase [Xanthomonadales bacterium]
MSAASLQALQRISLLVEVDSSNAFLLQLPAAERHGHAVLAEQQTAGRGRRGKSWQSPPGSNIYLSLGWNFQRSARDLSCLSLAVGVAAVRALESQGITGLGLKWPNDIQAGVRKLGGILLESKPAADAGISVVIGIGINVAMPAEGDSATAIDQPWTSVAGLNQVKPDSGLRDRLAGAVLEQLLSLLGSYEVDGFEPFRADWQRLDLLFNQAVTVFSSEGEINGHALGIDQQGNLRVAEESSRGEQRLFSFNSAEVSVRRAGLAGHE